MGKRRYFVDWASVPGARNKKRKIHLEPDTNGLFTCPVTLCLHTQYRSRRGCVKHIETHHSWWFYHDSMPPVFKKEEPKAVSEKYKATTHTKPAFSITAGCGKEFLDWLQLPVGGKKKFKDAKAVCVRAMKYLIFSYGDNAVPGDAIEKNTVDWILGSPKLLMAFLMEILDNWSLKASAALSYLTAISDFVDWRKCDYLPETVLRSFAVIEVYLRRSRTTLAREKRVEYSRNLDLERLIAKDSWSTLEELAEVIPYHTKRYTDIVKKAKFDRASLDTSEIAFATRFIISFLFLRVKQTRPASFQFLTLSMVKRAWENDYFVDQTEFKTSDQYMFDSLKFTEESLKVLQIYIDLIRPLCNPVENCDYVIITTAGTQYTSYGNALRSLTHEAIKKLITPTRLRAIVETEANQKLTKKKQETVSSDMKHTSYIAKRSYTKQLCRDVAVSSKAFIEEMTGTEPREHTSTLASLLGDIAESQDREAASEASQELSDSIASRSTSLPESSGSSVDNPVQLDKTPPKVAGKRVSSDIINEIENAVAPTSSTASSIVVCDNLEVKLEDIALGKQIRFTPEEDNFLKQGERKHANSTTMWVDILQDEEYRFQPGRTSDALRMRHNLLKTKKGKSSPKSSVEKVISRTSSSSSRQKPGVRGTKNPTRKTKENSAAKTSDT